MQAIEVRGTDGTQSAGCLTGIHTYCGGAIYWGHDADPYTTTTTPCRCACHAGA